MIDLRQAVMGLLAAAMSFVIIFGSLALSLAEAGIPVAAVSTPTPPPVTPKPGEPTFTASPVVLPTNTPTQPPLSGTCNYPSGWVERFVDFGETWEGIAQEYGISANELKAGNCLSVELRGGSIYVPRPLPSPTWTPVPPSPTPAPTDTFVVEQIPPTPVCRVVVPSGWVIYYVRRGDTLSQLGRTFGVSYRVIMDVNCLRTTKIVTGQALWVPYVAIPTMIPSSTLPPPTPTIDFRPTSTPVVTTPVPTSPPASPTPTKVVPTNTPVTPPTATPLPPTATPIPPTPIPSATPTGTEPD